MAKGQIRNNKVNMFLSNHQDQGFVRCLYLPLRGAELPWFIFEML